MKTLHFKTIINAPREKVWHTMLDDAPYREWTSVFNPGGSYYEGTWEKGSTIRFLGPDVNNPENVGGMLSQIAEHKPYEHVSIKHIGIINNGVEDTTSEAVKKWTPAFENYTFKDAEGGGTELSVDMDTALEYEQMFADLWPKALEKLKEMCEK